MSSKQCWCSWGSGNVCLHMLHTITCVYIIFNLSPWSLSRVPAQISPPECSQPVNTLWHCSVTPQRDAFPRNGFWQWHPKWQSLFCLEVLAAFRYLFLPLWVLTICVGWKAVDAVKLQSEIIISFYLVTRSLTGMELRWAGNEWLYKGSWRYHRFTKWHFNQALSNLLITFNCT